MVLIFFPGSSFYLWSEVFNVGFFLLQSGLRHKHGEVAVLHTHFLDLRVKEGLDGLPDGIRPGPQHIAAAHIIVLNHLCLSDDLQGKGSVRTKKAFEKIRAIYCFEWLYWK